MRRWTKEVGCRINVRRRQNAGNDVSKIVFKRKRLYWNADC